MKELNITSIDAIARHGDTQPKECPYTLMKLKSKMLKFVQSHIKKDILNNGAYTSRSYACWWTDGKSGRALVFDYTILPHQELVLIYKMRYESMENIIESNESVRDVRSLIERMNVRNNKKIHYTM